MTKPVSLTDGWTPPRSTGAISVEFHIDQVIIDLEPPMSPVADAMASTISTSIGSINETGPDGHQLFNVTGHLRESIAGRPAGIMTWAIAHAEDRLQGERGRILKAKLVELVPVLKDPSLMWQAMKVKAAVGKVCKDMIKVKKARGR